MIDVLAAEWIKLRSVTTTFLCLGTAALGVLLGTVLTAGMVAAYDGLSDPDRATFTATPMEEVTMLVAHLCLGVLGVLAVSTEYATGMIRTTLVAMPRRRTVLAAKALVVAAVVFVAGQAAVFGTFFLSRLIVADRPIPEYTSDVGAEVPTLFAMGLTAVVVALVGVGLGAVLRSVAGAVAGIAVLVYVFPLAAGNVPAPLGRYVDALSLKNLAFQVGGTAPDPVLPPVAALGVLAAYAAVAVGAGIVLIGRRDA